MIRIKGPYIAGNVFCVVLSVLQFGECRVYSEDNNDVQSSELECSFLVEGIS